jgi:hypothetical protein
MKKTCNLRSIFPSLLAASLLTGVAISLAAEELTTVPADPTQAMPLATTTASEPALGLCVHARCVRGLKKRPGDTLVQKECQDDQDCLPTDADKLPLPLP